MGGFTLLFLAIAWFVLGVHIDENYKDPQLAFWMEHGWSTGTQNDFSYLAQQAQDYNITDLYFHVGPITDEGGLADDLNIFTEGLRALPTTNYAWIGQIRSQINLDDEAVRQNIIQSAEWTLSHGFDGIHLDIEPVRPDDTGFQLLIQELHTSLHGDTTENQDSTDVAAPLISVAMDEWQPHTLSQLVGLVLDTTIQSYWTSGQIRDVAEYADQLVVMTYDTNLHDPMLYEWFVSQQLIALSKIAPQGTEVFIGIPSYEEGASLDPLTENIETGLAGYYYGITNIRTETEKIAGVAIYPYWEMDDPEWELLETIQHPSETN